MFTRLLPLALACSALAPEAKAELRFDLILPDRFEIRSFDPSEFHFTKFGILVNTGTEPIPLGSWAADQMFVGFSTVDLDRFELAPDLKGSPGITELLPGEAIGHFHPALSALMLPGETLLTPPSGQAVVDAKLGGPTGLSPALTFAVEYEDQRVEAVLRPTLTGPGSFDSKILSAARWSSTTVVPSLRTVSDGCAHAFGTIPVVPAGAGGIVGGTTARSSNLPVLDNERFIFHYPVLPQELVGEVWVLMFEPQGTPVSVLGCELTAVTGLIDFGSVPTIFPDEEFSHPGYLLVPIPDDPTLVGFELDFQWGVITPTAANGLFTASPGLRLHLDDIAH